MIKGIQKFPREMWLVVLYQMSSKSGRNNLRKFLAKSKDPISSKTKPYFRQIDACQPK